ncbi:hypothetical protein ACJWRV_27135 [Klebsiella pneumoniae]
MLINESAWEEMTCLFALSLCELQRRQGNIELVAFLACDIKQ